MVGFRLVRISSPGFGAGEVARVIAGVDPGPASIAATRSAGGSEGAAAEGLWVMIANEAFTKLSEEPLVGVNCGWIRG